MKIPKNAKRIPLRPLALGEKTGHHHSLCTLDETPVEVVCEMYEVETESGVKTYSAPDRRLTRCVGRALGRAVD